MAPLRKCLRSAADLLAVSSLLLCQLRSPVGATLLPGKKIGRGIDGGMNCATCTVLVSLLEQVAEVNNRTVTETLEVLCKHIPEKYQSQCFAAVDFFGPPLIQMLADKLNADVICEVLQQCHVDPGQKQCRLYEKSKQPGLKGASTFKRTSDAIKRSCRRIKTRRSSQPSMGHFSSLLDKHKQAFTFHLRKFGLSKLQGIDVCLIPGISLVCEIYNSTFVLHLPGQDSDKDNFSTVATLRGSSWRGKDCNDLVPEVHPGMRPLRGDIFEDSNCNGIYGQNAATGSLYESDWCDNSGRLGVIAIGDSVGAHFHAPVEWFDPLLMTKASFQDIAFIIGNELDWPQLSWATGYMNSTWSVVKDPTDSIYLRMRERNLCNHRDYQNVAVNGDDSFEVLKFVQSLARDPQKDAPALVIVELVGNDVCNNNPDTVAHMTSPEQMTKNMVTLLHELDAKLPNGSHVLLVGLADGSYLYDFLHNRTHPLGSLRNDLTYSDVYDWWNCLLVTPCYGWLTTNGTVRRLTTERAMDLSQAMKSVAEQYAFNNFDVSYMDNPITAIIREWEKEHGAGSGWQLIEAVDGFHPNQAANVLIAQYTWDYLEKYLPHYIGQPNPHNDDIRATFGDQGGH